jgi:glycosyltransferase involved in cell wall biosynthesis
MAENRICLNMIVKNESRIIERCIKSVYHLIDTWCIVDTGSTDGTQEIIKELLKDKPGELIEKPWVNFGHNRNEALELAERWGEWTLLTDADMVLVDEGFDKTTLDTSICGYDIVQENHGTRYNNVRILNSSKEWACIGVTHEYYSPKNGMKNRDVIRKLWFNDISDGGSKGDKFERDIALLHQGLIDEPGNYRYMFYLAQSYRDTGQYEKAVEWYKTCAIHDKWDEEKFFAEYQAGWSMCHLPQTYSAEEISKQLMHAWLSRPWRIEPIYQLAMMYKDTQNWHQAYALLRICASTPYPENDLLFIGAALYEGQSLDEFSIAAYWAGHYTDAIVACNQLISEDTPFSRQHKNRIQKNLWYSEKAFGYYTTENLYKFFDNKKESLNYLIKNTWRKEIEALH